MHKKYQYIVLLLLASLFCVKELASYKIADNSYSFCINDPSEDDTEKNSEGENDGDERNEGDLFLHPTSNSDFLTDLFFLAFHKSYKEQVYNSIHSKIHIPPPELV